jgi:hypothetical protein
LLLEQHEHQELLEWQPQLVGLLCCLALLLARQHLLLQRQKLAKRHYAVRLLLWQVQQAAVC